MIYFRNIIFLREVTDQSYLNQESGHLSPTHSEVSTGKRRRTLSNNHKERIEFSKRSSYQVNLTQEQRLVIERPYVNDFLTSPSPSNNTSHQSLRRADLNSPKRGMLRRGMSCNASIIPMSPTYTNSPGEQFEFPLSPRPRDNSETSSSHQNNSASTVIEATTYQTTNFSVDGCKADEDNRSSNNMLPGEMLLGSQLNTNFSNLNCSLSLCYDFFSRFSEVLSRY